MDFLDFLLDPRILGAVATGIQAGSQIQTGQQQQEYGEALREAARFEAMQLRAQASDALAASQRRAYDEERAAKYLASETLARAAASGGGASDPTVVNLIARQAEEGAYRQQVRLYEGETTARQLRLAAAAREYEGASREASAKGAGRATMLGAGATMLRGASQEGSGKLFSSLFSRFGGNGPTILSDDDYRERY